MSRGNQPAVLDDRDLVAELFRNFKHMGRKEDRAAAFAEFLHKALLGMRRLRVEADERLVQQQQFGSVDQREITAIFCFMPCEQEPSGR
jgi:hypothetical protein